MPLILELIVLCLVMQSATATDSILKGEDYHSQFSAAGYLRNFTERTERSGHSKLGGRMLHTLKCYHNVFQSLPNAAGLRVLDFGSGPTVFAAISAATKASEIVLSDYVEDNRRAIQEWLDRGRGAFDWSPHFSYVVQGLEGKSESEIEDRQDKVRALVKAVVHCDLTQDQPIEVGHHQPYDVVMASLVLNAVSQNCQEYKMYMVRLGQLVKPGGLLIVYSVETKKETTGFYSVGDMKFKYIGVTSQFMVDVMKDAGFCNVVVDRRLYSSRSDTDIVDVCFVGTKSSTELRYR